MDTEEKELERLKEILNIAFPESEKEELVMEQLGLPASSSYIVDDDMA